MNNATGRKTVVVVEDDPHLRDELVATLNSAPDIHCICGLGSGEEALLQIPKIQPALVLMDIRLPGLSGIDCTHILKRNNPRLEIVILTIYEEPRSIFESLKAGADGYLIKTTNPETLHRAVRDVAAGGAPLTAHIARRVVRYFAEENRNPSEDFLAPLTTRETEVLKVLARGFRYREAAKELGITSETVKSHVKNICFKLGVPNRVSAIVKYCESETRTKSRQLRF